LYFVTRKLSVSLCAFFVRRFKRRLGEQGRLARSYLYDEMVDGQSPNSYWT
jgi:hypothetical protein